MVSTRRQKYGLEAILELSKITTAKDEARRTATGSLPLRKLYTRKGNPGRRTVVKKERGTVAKKGRFAVVKTKRQIRSAKGRLNMIKETTITTDKQDKCAQALATSLQSTAKKRKRAEGTKATKAKTRKRKFTVTKTGETSMKIAFATDVKIDNGKERYNNKCRAELGKSPYLFFEGATAEKCTQVFLTLKDHHAKDEEKVNLNPDSDFRKPGHAYTTGANFHGIVEPLLSGATRNMNQKMGANELHRKLTYANGRRSLVCPNYHKAIDMPWKELAKIMAPSGKQNKNAQALVAILQDIRDENTRRYGDDATKIHEEALNAEDWTPGLLSLDFLSEMGQQELFDRLLSWNGVGEKIAACIMCFTFGWPVFIVDTHAFRILKWLCIVPRECTRLEAFLYMNSGVCPKELMGPLHQALWHHGIRCYKCMSRDAAPNESSRRWKECNCPLESLGITRFRPWDTSKKSRQGQKTTKKGKEVSSKSTIKTKLLKTLEERESALRVGLEVLTFADDDIWGMNDERANIKAEPGYYTQFTPEEYMAWRKDLKSNREEKKPEVTTTTTKTITTARRSRKKMIIGIVEEEVKEVVRQAEEGKDDVDNGEDYEE